MSQKKSLSSSRSWISTPANQSAASGRYWSWGPLVLRLHTRGPGPPAELTGLVVGNTCCHSHGGEGRLLGPLPHLSPFTLQPVKVIVKGVSQLKIHLNRCKWVDLILLQNMCCTISPAHALLSPLRKRENSDNVTFSSPLINAFLKTHTHKYTVYN